MTEPTPFNLAAVSDQPIIQWAATLAAAGLTLEFDAAGQPVVVRHPQPAQRAADDEATA